MFYITGYYTFIITSNYLNQALTNINTRGIHQYSLSRVYTQ